MALLGSLDHVTAILRAHQSHLLGADIDVRLIEIQKTVTGLIEEATGRTFGDVAPGTPADPTDELVWSAGEEVLILPQPARSIVSASFGGRVSGVTMTAPTVVVPLDDLIFDPHDPEDGLIYGLRRVPGGVWPIGAVIVRGDFAASPGDQAIPDEIMYAATLLITEFFRRENGMPSGVSGPDGSFQPFDPWQDPAVSRAIEAHRVVTRQWVI